MTASHTMQTVLSDTDTAPSSPAPSRELAQDEIHIWIAALDVRDSIIAESIKALSPAERVKAARYKSTADQNRFICRRSVLRMVLAHYLGVKPGNIEFKVEEYGKPSLTAPKDFESLSFNTSHSGALALIAVTRSGEIGVDIERLRSDIETEAVAARFFAAQETASLSCLHGIDRIKGFFNAWTRKESIVKALGRGLSISLESFEVSLAPGVAPAILQWNIPDSIGSEWRIHHLEPAPGYVGALAANKAAKFCRTFTWPA